MEAQVVYNKESLLDMDQNFRRELINTISGYKSANLISTENKAKIKNLAIFNSVVHIGANPPLLGFIMRPLTVPRHTYQNIKETGCFTINHVHKGIIKEAHQTSAKYFETDSEFEKCGFTPYYYKNFKAPFVKESRISLGLVFREELQIKSNDTLLIIGEIVHIFIDKASYISDKGTVNLQEAETVSISGLDKYYEPNFLANLDRARP
ncbi:MAG: flavin reductase [Bacteroidota bacterium]